MTRGDFSAHIGSLRGGMGLALFRHMVTLMAHPTRLAMTIAMGLLIATTCAAAEGRDASAVEIKGSATFESPTTVPVISIHGKSTAVEGRARIRHDGDNLVVEQLEAVLPIRTLSTGLGLRDEHMRKQVFTTPDGALPDVRFVSDRAVCGGTVDTKRLCRLSGELTIRGTARPFTITLDVKNDGAAFRAVGDGVAKLSTYGITAPSQLGVTTLDDVKLHLDFVVKRVEEQVARRIDR
jgi:polyisoprenoid-binding protein YceI